MAVLQSCKPVESHKCTAIDGCEWSALDRPEELIYNNFGILHQVFLKVMRKENIQTVK